MGLSGAKRVDDPLFSILTPVYETPGDVLARTLESVRAQTCGDWELCLVDDASEDPSLRPRLEQAQREDPRIRVAFREKNGGIVAASTQALEMAAGEFVVLLDHDDELHRDALASMREAILANPEADFLYSDEDNVDVAGRRYGGFYKPDWSPDRLRTQMYTCHLAVFRRTLVEEVGGFDPELEGSQDWDLALKAGERAREVVHVPHVLYHWRALETSAAGGGEAVKPWAFEAGRRAVQDHCDRIGMQARVERDERDAGVYHLEPALREQPPVSIVIPTRGQEREVRYERVTLLSHCVRSIVEESSYGNFEIVVVADADTPKRALAELREIAGERLRLVPFEDAFNFSAKINLGAAHSEGEHLLLLNDDVEVATPNWIERMVMHSQLPQVGAVGGRLLWEDGRLQHVVVRFERGLPGHLYRGLGGDFPGYANDARVVQNCLAVTGACLMTRRELFERVGGLSSEFPVNYNDIDYCLKLHAAGFRSVYDPDLVMYHFESSSRPTDVAEWEKELLRERWRHVTDPDPYSNPSLRHGAPRLPTLLRQRLPARLLRLIRR